MKQSLALVALVATAVLAAPAAQAQVPGIEQQFGIHVGYDLDAPNVPSEEELLQGDLRDIFEEEGALLVGAQYRIAPPVLPFMAMVSGDYIFADEATLLQVNLDGIYRIAKNMPLPVKPYVGLGGSLRYGDPDLGDSDLNQSTTALGLNILAGAVVPVGPLRPFLEARVVLGGNDEDVYASYASFGSSIRGGLLFAF